MRTSLITSGAIALSLAAATAAILVMARRDAGPIDSDREVPPITSWPLWSDSESVAHVVAPGEPLWLLFPGTVPRLCRVDRTSDGFEDASCSDVPPALRDKGGLVLVAGGDAPIVAFKKGDGVALARALDASPVERPKGPKGWITPRGWRYVGLNKGGGLSSFDPPWAGDYALVFVSGEIHWRHFDRPEQEGSVTGSFANDGMGCSSIQGGVAASWTRMPLPHYDGLWSEGPDPARDNVAMMFLDGERWSAPVTTRWTTAHDHDSLLACGPGVGLVTGASASGGRMAVEQIRCTPEGCANQVQVFEASPVTEWLAVAQLGRRTLLLWESAAEVRMRMAPFEQLARAREHTLFHLAQGTSLQVVRDDAAVVIAVRDTGWRLLHIDTSGDVRPLGPD
jgi:hypothetical protein